jgi:phosphopentomutase
VRIFLVVLDGVGAGALPDADAYGDLGSCTLGNLSRAVPHMRLPALQRLGLGSIVDMPGVPPHPRPSASFGRMLEMSPGKDSVTGHWEMMGVVLQRPFPTYPHGFPPEVLQPFEQKIGRRVLGNIPASGTRILEELGEEHVRTGRPILYTSADSVFQLACHEEVVPLDELYRWCRTAREMLTGEHAVGRVIARPFVGTHGTWKRTEARRDFPLSPPHNCLDTLCEAGVRVHAVGKIPEFFNSRGIHSADNTTNNPDHISALLAALNRTDYGLLFANLEDFDMLYGHRNDCAGFADALMCFDAALPAFLEGMQPDDLLILTNDHGNDPTTPSTDHSREYAFLLAFTPSRAVGTDLGIRGSFSDISATLREAFGLAPGAHGASFWGSVSPLP